MTISLKGAYQKHTPLGVPPMKPPLTGGGGGGGGVGTPSEIFEVVTAEFCGILIFSLAHNSLTLCTVYNLRPEMGNIFLFINVQDFLDSMVIRILGTKRIYTK